MKILVSFDNKVRPDSTGVYLVNGFQQLGHEVNHVLPEKMLDINGGHDLYVKCDDGLRVTQWNPELHPSHYYAIDTHLENDWRIELARQGKFDSISVVHSEGLKLPWPKEAFWLPVGCDPTIHDVGKRTKLFDGCFIGNFHSQFADRRIDMVDAFFAKCPVIFHGTRMFQEMAEKYAQSKIIFNCSLNGDVNMRVFEAMCSGSCLLTDRVPDLELLGFTDKVHYFGYSSQAELIDLTDMLLKDEVTRESVAKNGQDEVIRNHTYSMRMDKIIYRVFCGADMNKKILSLS